MAVITKITSDENLFAAALVMPTAEREHFLARACCGNLATLSRLTRLLDAFDAAADFVRTAPLVSENAVDEIRSYRLLRELGEGGCGIAYLAEQLAPVRRQVAIKVIKPGMDTKAVVARFEAERQLLALMDHPNVAKVFDAGSTVAGRPYFVMELVRGITITEYCDLMRLSTAGRLQLFGQVGQAIQHAHHKGVMHRDIKPSNVLVTMHDGLPLAKVIDFGIAKATQGPLSEQTMHTAIDQFIGTPAYISPEQTDLSQRNVDTRSDVYSLGVLLYELLTGCTPLDTQELLQSSPEEMRRRVREVEPLTPSSRLKAAERSAKDVQGDLDWIVMRCLEKEPNRRYQTVNDLLLDIQRHLRHETIDARPPDIVYAFGKFARRNRTMFAAMLAAAAFVIALAVNTSIQGRRVAAERDRVEQERQRVEKVAEFMLDTLSRTEPFGYAHTGQPETAKELLDRAGRWLRQDASQHPELRARLLESVGRAYRRRGDDQQAVGFLQEALNLRKDLSGDAGDLPTARVMTELAVSVRAIGDLTGADSLLQKAAAILRRRGEQRSSVYARVLTNRGQVQMKLARPDAAMKYYDESLALARTLAGPDDLTVAEVLVEQVFALSWLDDLPAAEHVARQAVAMYSTQPKLHPDRVYAEAALAEILRERSKFTEASLIFNDALHAYRNIYGENHRQVADTLDSLAKIARAQRRLAEAEELAQQGLECEIKAEGMDHFRTGYFRISVATIQIKRGEYAEAEAQSRAAIAVLQKTLPPDHPYIASAEYHLGVTLLATHRPSDAEQYFRAAMNRAKRAGEPEWRVGRAASGLGEALYRQGRAGEAESYFVNSYRIVSTNPKADADTQAVVRARVVRFYTERRQPEMLQALMDRTQRGSSAADRMMRVDANP
jgi:serine/threonine protein kinase/tetratricopeptide (TPR) repeat protein